MDNVKFNFTQSYCESKGFRSLEDIFPFIVEETSKKILEGDEGDVQVTIEPRNILEFILTWGGEVKLGNPQPVMMLKNEIEEKTGKKFSSISIPIMSGDHITLKI